MNEHDATETAYKNGYEKAVREIFEEIEKAISNLEYNARTQRKTVKVEELKAQVDWVLHEVIPETIAKIEEKYTEGEDNE